MDPNSSLDYAEALKNPPQGAIIMEWYEFLGVMILWDLMRSIFTAWLTKYWIIKGKKTKSLKRKKRKRS